MIQNFALIRMYSITHFHAIIDEVKWMFVSMMSKAVGLSECDREEEEDGRGECVEFEHDVFQSVIEKEKKKMDEVSVGAAASTSVVDLSGDSHLQVETQDLTKLLVTIKRLIFHIPKG